MNRLDKTFKSLKAQNKKAFIPYIMAGDPSLDKTKETVLMLEQSGADIVELGVPFSDPLADGPTIQRAAERALSAGVTLQKVLKFVSNLRQQTKIPVVLMTYYNPIFKYGEERFAKDAATSGVDGVIVPDLPPEEAKTFMNFSRGAGLATIFLLAPTSTPDRIKKVARASTGFIYYVSITGITGSKITLDASIREALNNIREITAKPVAVGFGVSTPEEAATVSGFADGVIIGSALVRSLNEAPENTESYIKKLREAI